MIFTVEGCNFMINSPVRPAYLEWCLIDTVYERPEREALDRFLDPDDPVIELGGCLGVVACLTNKRLRDPRRHVVLEPNPDVLPLLEYNRRQNDCHFTIVPGAIAYGAEMATLYRNEFFPASNVNRTWDEPPATGITVSAVTLGGLLRRFGFDRCTLVCDIEGAECALIEQERDTMCERVAALVLETHPAIAPGETAAMLRSLDAMRFQQQSYAWRTYSFRNLGL